MLEYYVALISLLIGAASFIYYSINSYMSMRYKDTPSMLPKENTKDVTIVVPVYKESEKTFRECIAAIKRQGSKFVVVCDSVEQPYNNITNKNGGTFVFQKERHGKRRAVSAAMGHVKTKYVLFVDSDTVIPDNAVRSMLSKFDENVGGVGTAISIRTKDDWVSYCSEFFQKAKEMVFKAMASSGSIFVISGRCAMYRTEAIKPFLQSKEFTDNMILGRKGTIAEDMHMTSHILKLGYKAVIDYNVNVITEPQGNMKAMFKQLVRWARGGYLYFFKDLYDGSYVSRGALYSFEMFYIYLLPIAIAATALLRLRLILGYGLLNLLNGGLSGIWKILFLNSASLGGLALAPELSLSVSIIGIAIFIYALSRTITRKRLKTIAAGGIMSAMMLLASLYALLTVWNQGDWLTR